MPYPKNTLNPERKEGQSSEKKTYMKPAIEEEAALPTASAAALTPAVSN